MLCKQCGFDLSDQANFCPKCGSKADENLDLLKMQPHPAKWLRIILGCILAFLIVSSLIILSSDTMTDAVSHQLNLLKEGKLTQAYFDHTSKGFQQAASLESFREFMNAYPVFSQNQSVRFIDRDASEDAGSLKAMILTDQGLEVPVHYQLVKEGDQWVIDGIKLEDAEAQKRNGLEAVRTRNVEGFDSKPLEGVIKQMMDLIRKGELKKAYDESTSLEFRQTTSYKEFEDFVKDNGSFSKSSSVELNDLSFDNNVATMRGILKDAGGQLFSVEYDMVEEKSGWKVFHVKVWGFDPDEAASLSLFSKFVLGSAVDDESRVVRPKTIFHPNSGDIYLNLYIDNIKSGTKVDVIFEHTDTQSIIPAVSKSVYENGNVILTFIFSPPPSGWPKGNYRLLAASSAGEKSSFDFKVE